MEISNAEVWHETVCLYSVLDLSSSELLGYLYLDMFSRFISFSSSDFYLLVILFRCSDSFSDVCALEKGSIPKPVFCLFKVAVSLQVESVRCSFSPF